MSTTNVAARLGLLVEEARRHGADRMTVPALEVWKLAFGLEDPAPHEIFAVLTATHRNIQRLDQQMRSANPRLLADCIQEIDALKSAFSTSRLDDPWNNTRQLLGDRVRLSLKACSAALEGRFDERELAVDQAAAADQLLDDFRGQIVEEALPEHVEQFLLRSIEELRTALRYMETLGADEFVQLADHLVGTLGRALAATSSESSKFRKVAKALGVTVASISAAVTMGLGVIHLDQETINLLPWGDHVDSSIVKCIADVQGPSQLHQDEPKPLGPGGK